MGKLRVLLVYKNGLSTLPDAIGGSPALEELNLYNNKLIKLPASLSQLSTLVDLNAAGNKLKTIPKTDNWSQLERLGIYWNNIVMLPSFEHLVRLKQLQMQDMQISSLPRLGPSLALLTEISAGKNRIEELNSEDIASLISLE